MYRQLKGTGRLRVPVDDTEVGAGVPGLSGLDVEGEPRLAGPDDGQPVRIDEGHGGVVLQDSQSESK